MVSEDPGHGHLNWELNPLSHGHFQVELSVPELAQVTTVLQALAEVQKVIPEETVLVKLINFHQHGPIYILSESPLTALIHAVIQVVLQDQVRT